METRSEQSTDKNGFCQTHSKSRVTTICRSPFCNYYRELCSVCVKTQQQHRQKFHLPIQSAQIYVQNKLRQIQKSILVLKKEKQQKTKTNPITLPYQVKQKLSHIREIINNKISKFQRSLEQMYEREVNMKLQNLSQTLRKSLDFLKNQLSQFQKRHHDPIPLKKYFINFDYWQHERKYYKSYMQEILQKQVKKFQQGFDDDNIMRLIVAFESNLRNIFSPIKDNQKKQVQRMPHVFLQQKGQLKKHQIVQRIGKDDKYLLKAQFMGRPYPKQNYKWQGRPQSIYYPDMDCFYIFGQGRTPSNTILKYEQSTLTLHNKLSFIGQMITKRSYFSLCLIDKEIFIIGGYNDKQGCLAKCQKMIVGPKNKMYLVSSLQQRSACHSVCNFKDKFILKFGGSSVKLNENQTYHLENQPNELYPQIYDIQRQQWRVIKYNTNPFTQKNRLQFGLQPLIVIPYETDVYKILIFGNRPLQKQETQSNITFYEQKRKQFQIRCIFTRNDIEMKIAQKSYELNKRYTIFPDTCWLIEKKNKIKAIGIDKNKNDNSLHLVEIKYQE